MERLDPEPSNIAPGGETRRAMTFAALDTATQCRGLEKLSKREEQTIANRELVVVLMGSIRNRTDNQNAEENETKETHRQRNDNDRLDGTRHRPKFYARRFSLSTRSVVAHFQTGTAPYNGQDFDRKSRFKLTRQTG
jgi:hypothetical protein